MQSERYCCCPLRRTLSWTCPSCHLGHTVITRYIVVHRSSVVVHMKDAVSFRQFFLFAFSFLLASEHPFCFVRLSFPSHSSFPFPYAYTYSRLCPSSLNLRRTSTYHCPPRAILIACTRPHAVWTVCFTGFDLLSFSSIHRICLISQCMF